MDLSFNEPIISTPTMAYAMVGVVVIFYLVVNHLLPNGFKGDEREPEFSFPNVGILAETNKEKKKSLSTVCRRRRGPGVGSGEKSAWNKRVRLDPPQHRNTHHKMKYEWKYDFKGVDIDKKAILSPLGALSATDAATGYPLSGHCVGRHIWVPAGPVKPGNDKRDRSGLVMTSNSSQFQFNAAKNPNSSDLPFRAQVLEYNGVSPGLCEPSTKPNMNSSAAEALIRGWDFYSLLQLPDGHWGGEYGGPLFLLPGLVVAQTFCGVPFSDEHADAMRVYILNHQQVDGGWALHIEGPSTVFGAVMNYVALRLLGVPSNTPEALAAQSFIKRHGGATMAPHWAKFYLAMIGVYEWHGLNPVPPEMWLLPRNNPIFHPGNMWCHSRMPMLGMTYLFGVRATRKCAIAEELKTEIFDRPYNEVNWDGARATTALIDLYAPHSKLLDVGFEILHMYEKYMPRFLKDRIRKPALDFALEYIHAEDLHTNYVNIGPVNKAFNMCAVFWSGGCDPSNPKFQRHMARVADYLWVSEDGMKMDGNGGSQIWDTAFACQALLAACEERGGSILTNAIPEQNLHTSHLHAPLSKEDLKHHPGPTALAARLEDVARRSYAFLDASQMKFNMPQRERFFRSVSIGGWPFSTNDQGWPVADCTAEGLKGVFALESRAIRGGIRQALGSEGPEDVPLADGLGCVPHSVLSAQRVRHAVDLLLAFQNKRSNGRDGGWATYEEQRGREFYEFLNPVEAFGDIMIDYSYTELTSSVIQTLCLVSRRDPEYRRAEVKSAIREGMEYLREQQRSDGSFYGSWAVNFTYGCWFGITALAHVHDSWVGPSVADFDDDTRRSDRVIAAKAAHFLMQRQSPDGGWGESYRASLTKQWEHAESTAVHTAWAVMALMETNLGDNELPGIESVVKRGINFIVRQQTVDGDWPHEASFGIFNRTCAITYPQYRHIFPLWALGIYVNRWPFNKEEGISEAITRVPNRIKTPK